MFLAFGVIAALLEAREIGHGRIVDASMVEGASVLMTMFHGMMASGTWSRERHSNLLDGGAPFYRTYETADQKFMAVGALEPQFYQQFVAGLGLDLAELPHQFDKASWPNLESLFTQTFLQKSQREWMKTFEGTDACVSPVLDLEDAQHHPHTRARSAFMEVAGVRQPRPAPRFSGEAAHIPSPPPSPGQNSEEILDELGVPADQIQQWKAAGLVS